MKKLISLLVLLVSITGFSQMKNVNKAETLVGEGNLSEAKELIDLAVENEKSSDKSKTWYVRGMVYQGIATATEEEVSSLDPKALDKALEAYGKVLEMEKEGSVLNGQTQLAMINLKNGLLNNGALAYQEEDYSKAYEHFVNAQKVEPEDTTAYLYAGAAAQSGEMYDKALVNYYKLLDLDYHKSDVYGSIIAIEKIETKDTLKALEVVRKGIEQFPDNQEFKREEINLLIYMNQLDDAMEKLIKAIESDSENPHLYYSLAYMYDESGNEEKAIENYERAIEKKSDFFEAYFNLAVLLYNKGAEKFKEANNLSIDAYRQKGDKIEEEGRKWFRKSLPYWLEATKLKPEDIGALENLQGVYIRLKMMDKAEEIRAKIESLGG